MFNNRQTTVGFNIPFRGHAPRERRILRTFLLAGLLLKSWAMASHQKNRPATRAEVLVGRSLAMCAHPFAAWGLAAPKVRLLILAGYFAMGCAIVLAALTLR